MCKLPDAMKLSSALTTVALMISPLTTRLWTQTGETGNLAKLAIVSAEYLPQTDTIRFKLVNNGDKTVTAYMVAIEVNNNGKRIKSLPGFGEDLLAGSLLAECGERVPYYTTSSPFVSPEGVIEPGGTHVYSVTSNIDKTEIADVSARVRVWTTGIIWSNGTFEASGTEKMPLATFLRIRGEQMDESARILTILNAHPEDANVQHRIDEATTLINARSSPAGSRVVRSLKTIASLLDPNGMFQSYLDVLKCEHQLQTTTARNR